MPPPYGDDPKDRPKVPAYLWFRLPWGEDSVIVVLWCSHLFMDYGINFPFSPILSNGFPDPSWGTNRGDGQVMEEVRREGGRMAFAIRPPFPTPTS